MHSKLSATAALTLLLPSCAFFGNRDIESPERSKPSAEVAEAAPGLLLPWPEESEAEANETPQPGDYYVYRFAGSFTDSLIVLTERIVGVEDGRLVVDFTLESADWTDTLRVRMDTQTRAVLRASRVTDDGEQTASLSDYHAFMARTQFAPDTNEGRIESKNATCLVGTEEVDCEVTRYHVTLGDEPGTLTISNSAAIPTRDIGGVLTAKDGTLVYSARLVEHGHETPTGNAVAAKLP